ncbi:hypothetical protein BDZ91DRAFT_176189 [Kalaharituber pfeilii]|nr:hypothetical protein BDZ91DRAFT_176189 [Kalaharituber pfeilii]
MGLAIQPEAILWLYKSSDFSNNDIGKGGHPVVVASNILGTKVEITTFRDLKQRQKYLLLYTTISSKAQQHS